MKKFLLMGLLLAGACRTQTIEVPGTAPVPVSPIAIAPRPAVEAFLAAIRAQDLQALSLAWGDKDGPIRDSKKLSREEVEQREIILSRCFKHDSFRILGEAPVPGNERVFQVELVRGTLTRVTDFFTARGPDRWYVREAKLEPVKDLCAAK